MNNVSCQHTEFALDTAIWDSSDKIQVLVYDISVEGANIKRVVFCMEQGNCSGENEGPYICSSEC